MGGGRRSGEELPARLRERVDTLLDLAGLEGADRREVQRELEDHLLTGLARGEDPEDLLARFGAVEVAAPLLQDGRARLAARRRRSRGGGGRRRTGLRERWFRELIVAGRRLAGQPRFSLTAAGTVATAVGAGTLVLALVHTVLLRPLPYPEPQRLVSVEHTAPGWGLPSVTTISGGLYGAYRASGALEDIGIYQVRDANVMAGTTPVRTRVAAVTPSLLATLGAGSAAGRLFTEEEGRPGAPLVAVLSHGLWTEAFGGSDAALGSTVAVDGEPHRIVGVLPEDFVFPGDEPRVLVTHRLDEATAGTGDFSYRAIGRLAPEGSPAAAEAALDGALASAVEVRPGLNPRFVAEGPLRVRIRSLMEREVSGVRTLLLVLLASVALLLTIAAANLATLYLIRGEHRGVELAVRAALGGRGSDLRATFAGEGILLGALGGAIGIGLATVGLELAGRAGLDLPRLPELSMAGLPLAGGLALAATLGLVAALAPRMPRGGLAEILRSGSGQSRGGGWAGGVRGLLVATQVALALVLVVGSGLMLRTGQSLARVEPGFRPEGLKVFDVALAPSSYPRDVDALTFHQSLQESVAALPGVAGVTLSSGVPLRNAPAGRAVLVQDWIGTREPPGKIVDTRFVQPGYLATVGIPIVEGRAFVADDARQDGRAVVVSAALARELWPGEPALGQALRMDGSDPEDWYTVVGVAGDVRDHGLREPPAAVLYIPLGEDTSRAGHEVHTLTYAVRTHLDAGALAGPVRRLLRQGDPTVPLTPVEDAAQVVRESYARVSLTLLLLSIAATVSLFMGVVGIFGVVSYSVERRAREMGIRKALGARPTHVYALVLRQGAALVLAGGVVGMALSLLLGRAMAGLLHGVRPADPGTFLVATPVVVVAAFLAAALPARRAARADPVRTLRKD